MKRITSNTDTEEAPWPDGTEHFVVLHDRFSVVGAAEPDPDDPTGTVIYELGDELPKEFMKPSTWSGHGAGFAALDANGERLDTRSEAEEEGVYDTSAIETWRKNNGMGDKVYVCEKCDKEFDTVDSLNGHQSAHRED